MKVQTTGWTANGFRVTEKQLQASAAVLRNRKRITVDSPLSPALFQGNENHTAQEGDRGCETNEDGQQAVIS